MAGLEELFYHRFQLGQGGCLHQDIIHVFYQLSPACLPPYVSIREEVEGVTCTTYALTETIVPEVALGADDSQQMSFLR